jgi:signal transduction histidine kinase
MSPWRKRSIATRLTMMNVLVSAAALLLACVAFLLYDQFTFRQGLIRTLSAQAQIIGSNSVSALIFNDPQAASNTLSALKSSPHISSAAILTPDQHYFARYVKDGGNDLLQIPAFEQNQAEGYWFRSTHAVLARKILSDGKTVGYVYIRADLGELNRRLQRYAVISVAVLLLSLVFALIISSRFSKSVAGPIIHLAETAQEVSREKNFAVRVPASEKGDELSVLINSFNEMLGEIQRRDNALRNAQDQLEQRVSDRTRELVSANRELESFSYSVSHDLRGPLDALNGFTYLLLKHHADRLDAKGKEALQSIQTAVKRMSELIEDLLNLSRVSTTAMHREKIDLSAFARSIMDELCRSAPDRKVEFIAPAFTEANADPRLLLIVMDNLLRNAWKYTSHHESARIEFGKETNNAGITYFVTDDGSGFEQRSADRLFQPFQRLHSGAEFPGNGIGLATVRRIIQRHGGEVWARGQVEKGATFYFTLAPARRAARAN